MFVILKELVILLIFQVVLAAGKFTIRPCKTYEDCGLGEYCMSDENGGPTSTCEYRYTDKFYDVDEQGVCNVIVPGDCKKNKCTRGNCVPLFGSYYCGSCGAEYHGKNCELSANGSFNRFSWPAVAFTLVKRVMTDRDMLVFVESFGTDFKLIIWFDNEQAIYKPHEFTRFESPKAECRRNKITDKVCALLPDRPMYGIRHTFYFNFHHTIGDDLLPTNYFYQISLTVNNGKEVEFDDLYYIPNAIEEKEMKCSPTVKLDNCATQMEYMIEKPKYQSFNIRAAIYSRKSCEAPKSISYEWRVYKVYNTANIKIVKPPISKTAGGNSHRVDPYTYSEGLYRIDIWMSALILEGETVKSYQNFAYCFFKVANIPLLCDIKGGASRTVSKKSPLTLHADPFTKSTEEQNLNYVWTCDANVPECKQQIVSGREFKPALNLQDLEKVTFTLLVIDLISFTTTSPVTQTITLSSSDSTELGIKCLRNCGTAEYPGRVADVVFLQAIDLKLGERDFQVDWSCTDQSGAAVDVNGLKEEGHFPYQLVVKENSLKPGSTYKFTAKGGSPPGEASYEVIMANKVIIARCEPEPNSGLKFKTKFKIVCQGFKSQVKPTFLRYEFHNVVQSKHQGDKLDLILDYTNSGTVTKLIFMSDDIYLKVCDVFENCEKKKIDIKLQDGQLTSDDLNKILDGLDNRAKEGRVSDLLMGISHVVEFFDKVEDKESAITRMLSAISKISINDYQQVKQICPFIDLIIMESFKSLGIYEPAESIVIAAEVIYKISYSVVHKFETSSYTRYDDYHRDFVSPAKHLVSSIEKIFSSRNEMLEKHEYENPDYAHSLYKYRKATRLSISSLELISTCLAKGLLQGQKEIVFNFDSLTYFLKVDTLLKMTDSIPNEKASYVKFPKELTEKLSTQFDSFSVNVVSISSNPFWWNVVPAQKGYSMNTDVIVLNLKKKNRYGSFSKLDDELQIPFEIFLNTKEKEDEAISGSTTLPPASFDDDQKDKSVSVHRLDLPYFDGQFRFSFYDIKSRLRVAFERNMRPDYDLMMSVTSKNVISSEAKFTVPFKANKGFDFFYVGLLPGNDTEENGAVEYAFNISTSTCLYWIADWRNGACEPVSFENDRLTCRCKHMSVFGGSVFVAPNKVDPINDIGLFLTVFDNPFIALIVLFCLILYVILLIWAWFKDVEDDSYAKLIVLKDNIYGDSHGYVVLVYTGIRIAAGTTSNVGIQIFGSQSSSRVHILKGYDEKRKVLKRASDDWFLVFTPLPLGKLQRLHIWLDFTGSNPSWYCSEIVIIDVSNSEEYVFMIGEWLTVLTDDGELEHQCDVVPAQNVKDVPKLARFNTVYGFREGHEWLAVFNRHPRSPITRKERLSVTLCFLLNSMLLSLMFYGAAKQTQMDDSGFILKIRDLMVAIECMALSFPISFLIVFIFKKSRGKLDKIEKRRNRVGDGCCTKLRNKITNLFEGFITLKPLQPVSVSTEIEERRQKRFWFYLGWSLCVFFILFDSFMIVLYSLKFGRNKSLKWLATVTLGQLQGTLIIEPVKVALFAVLLAVLFRKKPRIATYNIKELKPNEMISRDISPTIRESEMYKPPTTERIEELKKTYVPFWEQKWLLFDLLLTFTILLLCTIVTLQIDNTSLYYNNTHVTRMLTAPRSGTIGFQNVTNNRQLFKYMRENLLPSLYVTSCSNKNESSVFTSDCFNHLVKVPQIRQKRVIRGLCNVPSMLQNVIKECQALLSEDTEDKSTYEYSWHRLDKRNLNTDNQSIWRYQEEHEPDEKGEFKVPILEGYRANLGSTLQKSLEKLTFLKNNNWIDSLTRELFIEFILYNTNTNMFSLVRLNLIHPANSVYSTKIEVDSIILNSDRINYVLLFSMIGITCLLLVLAARGVFNFFLYGFSKYATRVGKIWECCSAVTGIFMILYFSIYLLKFFMYSEHMKQTFQRDYIPYTVISFEKELKFFTMYLIGFVSMVFLFSFRFGKPFEVMLATIWNTTPGVFALGKIALLYVYIVEMLFFLSQNPPFHAISFPFHHRSHSERGKSLFSSMLFEFSVRIILCLGHTFSLMFVLINLVESRYNCIGRKSYNLLYFIYEALYQKCKKQN